MRPPENAGPDSYDEECVRSVRILPMYFSAIADAILPGDDFYSRTARSDFSEMLHLHSIAGGVLDLTTIGAALAEFTPARVATTVHPTWKDKVRRDWEQIERPRIFAALEAFLLDGGLDRRLHDIGTFFSALTAAGVQFGNAPSLIDQTVHAGDWRKSFVRLIALGRDQGIRLGGKSVDRAAVELALQGAGFSREHQQQICGHLPECGEMGTEPWATRP